MPGPLSSLCLAVALAAASGGDPLAGHEPPDLSEAELRLLLDGQPLGSRDAGVDAGGRTGPVHPWRLFMARAPHSRPTVEAMLALLDETTEPERRTRLLQALSLQRDPRLRPVWNELITGGKPEEAERWAPFAFEGLLRIGEEEDHRLLMDLLGRDPRLDVWLMRAFGRTGARWASELVLRTYRSEQEHEPLRVAAFEAALSLSDDAAQLLTEGLHHRARSVRLAALGQVALCDGGVPVDRLVELAEEPDAEIASTALRLLERGCDSDQVRAETLRYLLAHPGALAGAPLLLLELGEWADGSGELSAAETLYRRAMPGLEAAASADGLRERALFRLGALLQLTGRGHEAAALGARLQRLSPRAGATRLVARVPGDPSSTIPVKAAAKALLSSAPPGAVATLARVGGWQAWRLAVRPADGQAVNATVHAARLCSGEGCVDVLEGGPATRELGAGEWMQLYVGDAAEDAADACSGGYAVLDVSIGGTWRGRVLARCEAPADLR